MNTPTKTDLSIIIPLYNEARCLEKNCAKVIDHLESMPGTWEIILINDGSTDDTALICGKITRKNSNVQFEDFSQNRGKGFAVKMGMLKARGRTRILMDADLAVPVAHVGECLALLTDGAHIVIGSRHLKDSRFRVPEGKIRTFLGGIYMRVTLKAFDLSVSDITCGLKGFSAAAAADVFSRSRINRWGYDAEILFIAEQLGYAIREIPVHWFHSFDSAVRVSRDCVVTFIEMLKIFINHRKGRYRLPLPSRAGQSRTPSSVLLQIFRRKPQPHGRTPKT